MDYFDCARMFTVYMTFAYGWIISEVKSRLTSYYKLCLVFRSIWLNCVEGGGSSETRRTCQLADDYQMQADPLQYFRVSLFCKRTFRAWSGPQKRSTKHSKMILGNGLTSRPFFHMCSSSLLCQKDPMNCCPAVLLAKASSALLAREDEGIGE